MSTQLVTSGHWSVITKAVRASRGPAHVAVAYFAEGAAELLPLSKGSYLVVDASEPAVKSGQTCPSELLVLQKRGVRIFSVAGLHANVFVLGRRAFVGSANVSRRSAKYLVEALVGTTDRSLVGAARQFVRAFETSMYEVGENRLGALQQLYRPPKFVPSLQPRETSATRRRKSSGDLRIVQLEREEWSEEITAAAERAVKRARAKRKHPRVWTTDCFRHSATIRPGHRVVMVTREDDGRMFVDPPADVLDVYPYGSGKGRRKIVCVELPKTRRRSLERVVAACGRGSKKALLGDGIVRDPRLRDALLQVWSQ